MVAVHIEHRQPHTKACSQRRCGNWHHGNPRFQKASAYLISVRLGVVANAFASEMAPMALRPMSLRARPPPAPPPNGGDASRLEHVLEVGFQMLSIKPEPIEVQNKSPGSGPSTAATEPCKYRRTLRSEADASSAQSKADLAVVGDEEVEIDEESGVHEVLGKNYRGVTSMEDALEAEEDEEQLEDARMQRIDKINAYKSTLKSRDPEAQAKAFSEMASAMAEYAVIEEEVDGELADALTDMTVKVLTYRKTLEGDSLAAQEVAFDRMVEALALYTSLENNATVERNVNSMVYIAYEKTFEDPYDTKSEKTFQNTTEEVTPYVGMVDKSMRDFDLIVIRKDQKIHLKLSARAGQRITNRTWVVSDTELPLANMQSLVLAVLEESGAVRTKEGMQTPSIKARLKAWLCDQGQSRGDLP